MTRLQVVAREFTVADEALRKVMLRAERSEATVKRLMRVMRPANPKRVEVIGRFGREVWSLGL